MWSARPAEGRRREDIPTRNTEREHAANPVEIRHTIEAWLHGSDLLLESYRYAPGLAAELPKHSHEEYQFGLSLDFPGEYRYRGARHHVPAGALSVIHPGEAHSARDLEDRRNTATFKMMYMSPILLQQAEAEVGVGREHSLPFFPVPVILDEDLAGAFLGLHVALGGATSRLQRDSLLLSVLARFVQRHSETRPRPRPVEREHRAVKIVREYLEDNWTENVSLEQLARLANLSSFHLARTFRAEVGIPPHAYQLQVRTVRAKELLLRGWSVARVALEMGFADQSHFSRHFKRLVGVPPGSYVRNSKNVQDVIP